MRLYILRRERDSNPRRCDPQRFSRPPHSTALPSLLLRAQKYYFSAEIPFFNLDFYKYLKTNMLYLIFGDVPIVVNEELTVQVKAGPDIVGGEHAPDEVVQQDSPSLHQKGVCGVF